MLTLHMGCVDTGMTQGIDLPKSTPEQMVTRALDALEAGADPVLADDMPQQAQQALSAPASSYRQTRE